MTPTEGLMTPSQQEPYEVNPVLRNLHVAIVEAGTEAAESTCSAGDCGTCPLVAYDLSGHRSCGFSDLKWVLSRMGPDGSTAVRRRDA